MTNQLAKIIPKASTAMQRFVTENEDGQIFAGDVFERSTYEPIVLPNGIDKDDATYNEYHKNVVSACAVLSMAFPPSTNSDVEKTNRAGFYSVLYYKIEEIQMPIARLKDAISHVIETQKYFKVADIISFDKKVLLSESKDALSAKLKRKVHNVELAITYDIVDGRVVRLFALMEEIKHSEYYMRKVIGVWDAKEHGWKWIGEVNDPSMENRKVMFKKYLYKFCNCPGHEGPYDVGVVKSFYEHFSKVMPPGDQMRWEMEPNFNPDTWLETWYQKHKNNE